MKGEGGKLELSRRVISVLALKSVLPVMAAQLSFQLSVVL